MPRNDLDADGNAFLLAMHGGKHFAVFVEHPSTMSAGESLSMASVAGLMAGWEETALRTDRHAQTTSGNRGC
jgi:hypothetical protein